MAENGKLKVGDKIIEHGQVFRVFKVENKKNSDGAKERIIHFRPYFKSNDNKGMICSIPESGLSQTNIRRPRSRKTIVQLIKKLSEEPLNEVETDVDSIKRTLGLNDLHETIRVVRGLWIEKLDPELTFTKSKSDMFKLATSRITEEVAFVINASPDKASDRIQTALEKGHK